MSVVEAVVVRRHSRQACPDCDSPVYSLEDTVELGTVVRVDLAQRHLVNWEHGDHVFQVEVLPLLDHAGELVPADLLRAEGRDL